MRNVVYKSFRENQNTLLVKSFSKIRDFCEDNMEKYGTARRARHDDKMRQRKDAILDFKLSP